MKIVFGIAAIFLIKQKFTIETFFSQERETEKVDR